MSVYTVHEPPQRDKGASASPDRFVFVRDGFYFWAMIFGPVWLLFRRLWLALFLYVVGWIALAGILWFLNVGSGARLIVYVSIAILFGLEASSLRRWTLNRRRWKNLGVMVGDDIESAERRFFQIWRERPQAAPAASKSAMLTNYGPKTADGASDVIGLFPEPGGPR